MKTKLKLMYKILKAVVTGFLVIMLLVILVQRVSKNNLAIGGIRIFNIVSESMTPKYEIGDILISKKVDPKDIKIGDSVTYMGKEDSLKGLVVTHGVIEKRQEDGKYYFITKGLANLFEDPEISEDDIFGKVVYKTTIFSFFGRLMNNIVVYYGLFVVVGLYFSYQIVSGFFIKDEEIDENE